MTFSATPNYKLTLGPCLFNWKVNDWRDFYFQIADESSIDEVYLGEVVCYKRDPFFKPAIDEVITRLEKGGKKVILSTYFLMLGDKEMNRAKDFINKYDEGYIVESNDVGTLGLLKNKPYVVGPGINIYNEESLKVLLEQGAIRFSLPGELSKHTVEVLAQANTQETEIQIFGRLPLAISARCYHARIHGTGKSNCGYICEQDYNAKSLQTLSGQNFLAINGTQTMSYTYVNLLFELEDLQDMGVNVFRISPHYMDMVKIIQLYKDVLDKKIDPSIAYITLEKLVPKGVEFSNGFYYGIAGRDYTKNITASIE